MIYNSAKKKLESGQVTDDLKKFFKENNHTLEYGYCLLLERQLSDAKKILTSIESVRADWATKLIQFMQGYVEDFPTYFQIRNFLEIDLNLLIQAQQAESVSFILGGAHIFFSINCESYKYIARVFMNNGFLDIAKHYIDSGKQNTDNDPELYFMDAQYNLKTNNSANALISINECLKILPEYYPAIKIKEKLLKEC